MKSIWDTIIKSEKPILIDFYREGCDGCITMDAVIDQLRNRIQLPVEFIQLDIEKIPQSIIFFQIKSVPTLILFQNGEIFWKHTGLITAGEVESQLKALLTR